MTNMDTRQSDLAENIDARLAAFRRNSGLIFDARKPQRDVVLGPGFAGQHYRDAGKNRVHLDIDATMRNGCLRKAQFHT